MNTLYVVEIPVVVKREENGEIVGVGTDTISVRLYADSREHLLVKLRNAISPSRNTLKIG